MRRFGGLVVGVLLLTGCGAGGGLASTTASAVSSAAVSSAAHTTTAAPASTRSNADIVDGFFTALYKDDLTVYADFANTKTAPLDPFYHQNLTLTGTPIIEKTTPQPDGVTMVQVLVPGADKSGKQARYRFVINIQGDKVLTFNGSELLADS